MSDSKEEYCIHFGLVQDENGIEIDNCAHPLSATGNCCPAACPRANGYTHQIVGE